MGLFREFKLELSVAIFVAGLFMTLLVLFQSIPALGTSAPDLIRGWISTVGNFIFYVYVAGPLLALGGGYYLVDLVRKRREFDRLVTTTSKAMFVRNQEHMEKLLWHLPLIFERRYLERRKEFKIRE